MRNVVDGEWYWCSGCLRPADGSKVCPDCYVKLAIREEKRAERKAKNTDTAEK